jgi:hypothetical protein
MHCVLYVLAFPVVHPWPSVAPLRGESGKVKGEQESMKENLRSSAAI